MRQFAATLLFAIASISAISSAQDDANAAAAVMRRAQEAYDEGDFELAAVLLKESLALYEAPEIHHNLARTLSELSRWEESREHFQRFLELSPHSSQRASVLARIVELDRRIEREAALERSSSVTEGDPVASAASDADRDAEQGSDASIELETDVEAVEPSPLRPRNAAPFILVGGGTLVALAALPIGLGARGAEVRASEAPTHRDGAAELAVARRLARSTNTLLVTGGVIAVAGVIWAIAKPRESERSVSFDGTSLRVRF